MASGELFNKLSLSNEALWTAFIKSGDLNSLRKLKLSAFETVAAVSVLRPDSLYRAIATFVDDILGECMSISLECQNNE